MKRHHSIAIALSISALLFMMCAIGVTTAYASIALIVGNVLVFSFVFAMFCATLQLQKLR